VIAISPFLKHHLRYDFFKNRKLNHAAQSKLIGGKHGRQKTENARVDRRAHKKRKPNGFGGLIRFPAPSKIGRWSSTWDFQFAVRLTADDVSIMLPLSD
jgi:hypothetical protein